MSNDWKSLPPAGTIPEVLEIMECLRLRIEAVEMLLVAHMKFENKRLEDEIARLESELRPPFTPTSGAP